MKVLRRITRLIIAVLVVAAVAAVWWWYRWAHTPGSWRFPRGIVIHHTATPPVVNGRRIGVAEIDAMHARRGFAIADAVGRVYHIGYHFLVLQDGTVMRGRPERLFGAHTKGHPEMLGIALVGNFQQNSNRGASGSLSPPRVQLAAAERLTRQLMAKYELPINRVFLHRDLCQTACPGDNFPRTRFFRSLPQQRRAWPPAPWPWAR